MLACGGNTLKAGSKTVGFKIIKIRVILVIHYIKILTLVCCITACSREVQQPFSLDDLYHANPIADAQKAIAKGDLHVYALYGHHPYTPNIKRGCISDEDIVPIEGTSDTYQSYEEAQFNTLASLYAEYYNSQIKFHLVKKGNTCFYPFHKKFYPFHKE